MPNPRPERPNRKLLRTVRFDDSDERIYELAAEAGEWALSGAFAFAVYEPRSISGRTWHAFTTSFMGMTSFGRSTFAAVEEVSDAEIAEIERRLAEHLVANYGAPSLKLAFPAVGEEIRFALDLCKDLPVNTVVSVRRTFDEKGRIKEEFGTLPPPDAT